MLFVQNEFSYDHFFTDSNSIYKMVEERKSPEKTEIISAVPYSFVRTVVKDYPEVESATAIAGPFPNQRVFIKNEEGEKIGFLENNVLLADSNFFSVFSFKMLKGNRETALKNPHSVVLTQSTARRYFGGKDPLNKFISAAGKNSVVTGVCEDPPSNSQFKFSYLVSSTSVRWLSQEDFNLRSANCYFKLHKGADVKALENKFPEMVKTYIAGEIEKTHKVSWDDHVASGNGYNYFLKPLTSIHLDTEVHGGMKPGGSMVMLRVLIIVGFLIFIIACINFMNLSTARSMERAKEVGIRKVMGSFKIQLVFQFLTESFILSFLSLTLAIGVVLFTLPYFNALTNTALQLSYGLDNALYFASLTIFIGLLAGLYPAFVLSSFKPVNVLKGNFTVNKKGKWVKNGLVVFQFWISIVLITSTIIMQKQIDFLGDKNLGFDTDQLLVVEGAFHKNANYTKPFLEEIKSIPEVKRAAGSLWIQGFQGTRSDEYRYQSSAQVYDFNRVLIGDDLAEVMNFELREGAFFSETTNDADAVILNESAVKTMGIENPIGKKIGMITQTEDGMGEVEFTIKGVVKDFNYHSLHTEIEPLIIQSNERYFGRMAFIAVKIEPQNVMQTISQLENKWKTIVPDRPFNFRFMDDVQEAKYQSEKQLGTIFTLFSGLSIFISVIGLIALSAYTISLRRKEIGIRKVVGASIPDILLLLSTDFTKLVLISFLLATPLAWYLMNEWLTNFAYSISLSLDTFIFSGLMVMLITWFIIIFQALKTAMANPVKALKDE